MKEGIHSLLSKSLLKYAGFAAVAFCVCSNDNGTITPVPTQKDDPNALVWSVSTSKQRIYTYRLSIDSTVDSSATIPALGDSRCVSYYAGRLWVGAADGRIRVFTATAQNTIIADTVLTCAPPASGAVTSIGYLSATSDGVWAVMQNSASGIEVLHIDAQSFAVVGRTTVGDSAAKSYGLHVASNGVWVPWGNPFTLARINPVTHTVLSSTYLGQDSLDPTGPRGKFDGSGVFAAYGDFGWVLDRPHYKLLKIDLAAVRVVDVFDVSSFVNGTLGRMAASSTGLYASNGLPPVNRLFRIDMQTGTASGSWSLTDGFSFSAIYAKGKRLLALGGDYAMNGIHEIDGETMQEVAFTGYRLYSSYVTIE